MPVIVQLSIVAVAVAFVAFAIVAIRTLQRLDKSTDQIIQSMKTISDTVAEVKPAIEESRQVIARFGAAAPHIERVAERFARIGHQVADVSESVVHEVETPLRAAAAVARGVRIGTNHLIGRVLHGRNSTNAKGGSYDG